MERSREISIKGIGNLTAKPDYVIINLGLEKIDQNYSEGYKFFADHMKKLQKLAEEIGGIDYLAVATVDEAIKLRESGIEEKILMLSPVIDKYELEELIKNDITITIGSLDEFSLLLDTSSKLEKEVNTHIKIDTGFGRYGFIYTEKNEISRFIKVLIKYVFNLLIICLKFLEELF